LRAYLHVGRNNQAENIQLEILESVPDEQDDLLNLFGRMNHVAGRFDRAEELFKATFAFSGRSGVMSWRQARNLIQNLSDLAAVSSSKRDLNQSKEYFEEMRRVISLTTFSAPELSSKYFRDITATFSFKQHDVNPFFLVRCELNKSLKAKNGTFTVTAEFQNPDGGEPISVLPEHKINIHKGVLVETDTLPKLEYGYYRVRVVLRDGGEIVDVQNVLVRSLVDTVKEIKVPEDLVAVVSRIQRQDTELQQRLRETAVEDTIDTLKASAPIADGFTILDGQFY